LLQLLPLGSKLTVLDINLVSNTNVRQ